MPRLRLRRMLLTIVGIGCITLAALNLRMKEEKADDVIREQQMNDKELRKTPHLEKNFYPREQESAVMEKLWFMKNGVKWPVETNHPGATYSPPKIWPHEEDGDRIENQLMYIPTDYASLKNSSNPKLKKILLYFGKAGWNDLPLGRQIFTKDKCPVDTCEITTAHHDSATADAIFFKDRFAWPRHKRPPEQVWILFLLECPLHTQGFTNMAHVINWTATYRHDSDIVAPYEKFILYDKNVKALKHKQDYAAKKTKKVAWFVSNCAARNGRLQYARELAKHIELDIYGTCGAKRCPRTSAKKCFDMLDIEYKFYLAFENSNCKDYITEKFFVNGLSRNVVPIVMGARPEDYRRNAPYHSYIHVEDFESPKHLAEYLHRLEKNSTLYNEYFQWKGTGEFVNTYFWCRLCALLHAPPQKKVYSDIHTWWAGPGTCTTNTWRNLNENLKNTNTERGRN
ncbi:glycoprotein 3-alpha-L-fucosyltransferase A-like [Tachypleus tridentatus]|uniref:glycoprotein 3-alpha-L-fucosyltransferase A-like n=1 Tax=Tachypleus tridentatus TaxID=6853 RepID=UPI003FD5C524